MFCGQCANYRSRPNHEDFCTQTGKVVGYLAKKECFTPKQIITMNEEKPMEPEKVEIPTASLMPTKYCKNCGRELPLTEFGKHWKTADGYQPICNDCRSAKAKAAWKTRGEKSEKKNTAPATKVVKNQASIETIADRELVAELRRRGWEVKCTKTTKEIDIECATSYLEKMLRKLKQELNEGYDMSVTKELIDFRKAMEAEL